MKRMALIIIMNLSVGCLLACGGNIINDIIDSTEKETENSDRLECSNVGDDQICTDTSTGLIWRKCSLMNYDDETCDTSSDYLGGYQYCNSDTNNCNGGTNGGILDGQGLGTSQVYNGCDALNSGDGYAGKKGWRVPTRDELEAFRSVFLEKFPNYSNGAEFAHSVKDVWSSTSYNSTVAYMVDGITGNMDRLDKTEKEDVRCVTDDE